MRERTERPSTGIAGVATPIASEQPSTRLSFVLPLALGGTGRPGNDLARAGLLFESFERCFKREDLAQFLVVTRPRDFDAVAGELARGRDYVELLCETELCPELGADPPSLSEFPKPNHGWFRQQLIKLGAARRIETDFYMTLDADVIFAQPFTSATLISGGRAVVNTQTFGDFRRLFTDAMAEESRRIRHGRDERARAILGVGRTRDCFYGETPVVLSTTLVRALLDSLESSSGDSWASHLLAQLPWAEQSLYFTFAEAAGTYDNHHFDGGCDAVLRFSDSLWYPPADYRVPRTLANWTWSTRAAEDGVAVVVQSYLGYDLDEVRAKLAQLRENA